MPQQISRKIFTILIIFLILSTYNNKNISEINLLRNNNFTIIDSSDFKNEKLNQELSKLKNQNLFLLSKERVLSIINSYQTVEDSYIFKKYPSSLNIKIWKTQYLAITKKKGYDYYLGSNGNFIKVKNEKIDLPYAFGNIDILEFLKLKKIIDASNFDYQEIKNFYYFKSKRWDLETKNGLLIRLPQKKIERSFEILSNILDKESFSNVNNIDLRNNNQIIING